LRVFVLPSWFPPNGGSFFLEQSIALNEIVEEIVLYVEPMSIKMLIKNPFKIKKLFSIQEEIVDGLKIIRGFNLRVPKLFLPNLYIEKFAYLKLYKYALKKYGKPDLIHVHSSVWGGWYAYWIKKIYNIPYIITEHRGRFTNNSYIQKENLLPYRYSYFLKKAFSNSFYILLVSQAMKKKILEYSGKNKNIKIIHNMVNKNFLYKRIEKYEVFTFIVVAGLNNGKAIDILLYALEKFSLKVSKSFQLLIIGSGNKEKMLKQISNNLNLENNIKFLGQQNRKEVAIYMQKSHVFVLPTRYEGFSVAITEALFSGLPVITTKNVGGNNEAINEKNGLLVEIDNIEELAKAMEYLYKNYSKYNNFEIAKDARKKYGKESFKKAYEEVYKKVVNEG
jgi:glycosyltransferase involved in cell wall biosynthesis